MTFWISGEWRKDREAIGIDDRGFLLGDGVFETILVRDGAPAFLDRHLARLKNGLKLLSIAAALPDDLRRIIEELARKNGAKNGDARLRLTVTRGPAERGLINPPADEVAPTVLMTMAGVGGSTGTERKLVVSESMRANAGIAMQCKTPSYVDNIIAYNDAVAAGADDAVMLNPNGVVACASAANIFVIMGDTALTPPVSDGALPGIVRGVLLDKAASAGATVKEQTLTPAALREGAVFLTNSLIGLVPARLDGAPDTRANEIFIRLEACYHSALAEDIRQAGRA